MFSYRTILAAVVSLVIAAPVLADDTSMTTNSYGTDQTQTTTSSGQSADQGATSTTTTTQTTTTTSPKVNINTATKTQLVKIKGIDTKRAKAIIAYRAKNGNFTTLDDLAKVKGFNKLSKTKLQSIEAQLSVD